MIGAPDFTSDVIAGIARVLAAPIDEVPPLRPRFFRDSTGSPETVLGALADLVDNRTEAPASLASLLPGGGWTPWSTVAITTLSRLGLRDQKVLARALQAEEDELADRLARHDAAPKRGAA